MSATGRRRIFWSATLGLRGELETLLTAASGAGADEVSVYADAMTAMSSPERAAVVRRAADLGLTIGVVDGLYTWMPVSGRLADRASPLDAVMAAAAELGASGVNALAVDDGSSIAERADRFAAAADRAAAHGVSLMLEFAPLGGVPDLATAWAVVGGADPGSTGVLFDTWHFFRSDPDLDLLASLPGERILAVQISDAATDVQGTLWEDTIKHRRLPGDGDIDLPAIIAVLDRIGGLSRYGPEVISEAMQALPPHVAARLAMDRVDLLVGR